MIGVEVSANSPSQPEQSRLDREAILAKAGAENFPVASRLLPAKVREHLFATYAFARAIDDLGDLASGDRLAQLDWAERELDTALSGGPTNVVFQRVASSAHTIGLSRDPYVALIDANRMDQRVTRYQTYADLEGYCALSANPVGRIVLAIFGCDSERARQLSDRACTALQVIEHMQDLGEDYRVGRVYLPQQDLTTFGVRDDELGEQRATPQLRRLVAFECERSRAELSSSVELVSMLPMLGKVAVSGFIGGGLAQLDAIEGARFDTLSRPVKASKATVASRTAAVFAGQGFRRSR